MQLNLFDDWRLPFQRWLLNFNCELPNRYILNDFDVYVHPHVIFFICGEKYQEQSK